MPDEKDRFGDKLRDAEKGREDQYFARRDRDLVQKLKGDAAGQQEQTLREQARMRCPKCGERLVSRRHLDVTLEECRACGGVWLDRGELEQVARHEVVDWVSRYLGHRHDT
jgi:hypothetical protein